MLEKIKLFVLKYHFLIILCLTIALSFISVFSVKAYSIIIYISEILVSVFYGLSETIIFWLICPFFEGILDVHILALLLVVLAIQILKDIIKRKFVFEKNLIFPIVITAILIIMCFVVNFQKTYFIKMLRYIEVALICLEFFYLRGRFDLEKIIKISSIILIFSFLVSFLYGLADKTLYICNIDSAGLKRYVGLTGHENILAIYSISYMAFFMLFYFKNRIKLLPFCFFEVAFFVLGFLTMSKAFLLLFILLLICYFIKSFTINKKASFIQLGVACVVFVLFAVIFRNKIISLFKRFTLYEKDDGFLNMVTTGRVKIWEMFYWVWCSRLDYMFFGIGASFNPEFYVHNFYYDLVLKFGIVGFIMIFLLAYYYISVILKGKKIHFENIIPILILACYMFIEVFMDVRILFIIFAIDALTYLSENKKEEKPVLDAEEQSATQDFGEQKNEPGKAEAQKLEENK